MPAIKVSIMVLVYNHEKYLKKSLDSIVKQETNFRFEAIIGDDYSTDESREIIREYAEKYPDIIKPIFRKKNIGASRNVVSTLRKCTGEYVAFLEGDDYWLDNKKLQKQADFLDAHKDYAGVATRVNLVNRYGTPITTGPKLLDYELKDPMDFARTTYPFNKFKFIGCLMTRNLWAYGKYEKIFLKTQIVTDQFIFAITLMHGKIGYLNDLTAAYRWVPSHGGNYSSQGAVNICPDRIIAFQTIMKFYPKETHSLLYLRLCRDYWTMLHYFWNKGLYKDFLELWFTKMTFIQQAYYVYYYCRRKLTGDI